MKALRVVFIILGVLCFLINVLGYVGMVGSSYDFDFSDPSKIIGYNLFFLLGVLLAFLSWKTGKRIEKKKAEAVLDSLVKEAPKDYEKEVC